MAGLEPLGLATLTLDLLERNPRPPPQRSPEEEEGGNHNLRARPSILPGWPPNVRIILPCPPGRLGYICSQTCRDAG
eukprot:2937597-Pyramimonas_sp.AAC.1